jgi:hypothetical protein
MSVLQSVVLIAALVALTPIIFYLDRMINRVLYLDGDEVMDCFWWLFRRRFAGKGPILFLMFVKATYQYEIETWHVGIWNNNRARWLDLTVYGYVDNDHLSIQQGDKSTPYTLSPKAVLQQIQEEIDPGFCPTASV